MEQNLKARAARAKKQAADSSPKDVTALLRSADVLIHVLLSSVLSGAVVLGQSAPLGVAMAGASGSGLCGAAALSGACFGYMTLLGFSDGLRYAAAAILTFAVGFAFYDVKLLRGPCAMPVVAGVMNACTGFVYLSQQGWRTVDVIYFLTEIVLTIGGAWGFRMVLTPIRTGRGDRLLAPERRVGLLILLCALLASLSSLYLYKEISLGRILAAACLGAAGWLGGPGTGALAGVSIGLALDLAEIRLQMEPWVAGMAAERATAEDLKNLRDACTVVEQDILAERDHSKSDVAFHVAIAECTHNLVVPKLIPIITYAITLFVSLTESRLRMETLVDHRELLDAICSRDGERAASTMTRHIEYNRALMQEIVGELKNTTSEDE